MKLSADDGIAGLVIAGSGFEFAQADGGVHFAWDGVVPPPADVLWLARAGEAAAAQRVIAPSGKGLWRHAPWPAADALFELEAPRDHCTLVVGDAAAEVSANLGDRDLVVTTAARLEATALEKADVVVFVDEGGAPLAAEAPAVLASGRVLVMTPRKPAFGLRPGIDHCQAKTPEALADIAEAATLHWDAFRAMRVHGRIAAERHRASRVLRDLMIDLKLDL